jgi:crotonobetainyl-CoA:carnitine CoA-transferase CaiB-like acyl-CoA transferase
MKKGVLEGIRVLDFGRYIAGPYCAALLGDLGAEVIRVERVEGGEDRFVSPVAPSGDGALFLHCNRGKSGMTLNPSAAEGREITRRLVATADVVVANLPVSVLRAMGLDYPSLIAVRPNVILTMVTAFGSEGPYSERVGFDGVGQAMSSAMHLSGTQGVPSKSAASFVDFVTALSSALGTLAALLERERTGRGQIVEASLLGSALAVMNSTLVEQALLEVDRVGTGNRSQVTGPSDTFRTRDGWVLVQTVGQPMFERWTKLVGEEPWREDPRFRDDLSRGVHGELLSRRMAEWCAERTTAEAIDALKQARIPSGPVYSPRQTLEDPHVRSAGFFQPVSCPGIDRPVPLARTPFRLSGGGVSNSRRAPTLGEHTAAILESLGYDAAQIAGLRRDRVI